MDVRDHGDRREADDLRQGVRVLGLRDRAADDLAAGRHEGRDLRGRRLDVVRLRQGHGLDDDGRAAADRHPADRDLSLAGHGSSLAASQAPDVVGQADEHQDQEQGDPHRGDALVDLAAHRAATQAFDQREQDVPAVER